MSDRWTVALCVLVSATLATAARADSLSSPWYNPSWTYYGTDPGDPASGPSPSSVVSPPVLTAAPVLGSVNNPVTAAVAQPTYTPTVSAATGGGPVADAYLNFGSSSYPEVSQLTAGAPAAWYTSPVVQKLFGGAPTAAQQAQFTGEVLNDVSHTFQLAGMNPKLTTDPAVAANHTMSLVSGVSYAANANAIGITDVGHNGFGFIDKFGQATTVDQLALAVAHNLSHELMHAFGVGYHPDQSGKYIDAGSATWALLTDPNTTFSPAAVTAINGAYFSDPTSGSSSTEMLAVDGDMEILQAVPEPATWAAWGLVAAAGLCYRRNLARRPAAAC